MTQMDMYDVMMTSWHLVRNNWLVVDLRRRRIKPRNTNGSKIRSKIWKNTLPDSVTVLPSWPDKLSLKKRSGDFSTFSWNILGNFAENSDEWQVLAKMEREGLTEKVHKDKVLSFYFPDPDELPPPVLQFQEVKFRGNFMGVRLTPVRSISVTPDRNHCTKSWIWVSI